MQLPTINSFLGIKTPKDELGPPKAPDFSREQLGEKRVFLRWEAMNRAEKRGLSKKFIRAFTIIGIFVGLLLIAMQEFFVILVIGSMIFVTQALMRVPPEKVVYELSSFGISIDGRLYYWDQLRRYFFIIRDESNVVAVDTVLGVPGRIFLNFEAKDKETIKEVLNRYLHYLEEEPKTFFDDAYSKIVKRFSFDDKEQE